MPTAAFLPLGIAQTLALLNVSMFVRSPSYIHARISLDYMTGWASICYFEHSISNGIAQREMRQLLPTPTRRGRVNRANPMSFIGRGRR